MMEQRQGLPPFDRQLPPDFEKPGSPNFENGPKPDFEKGPRPDFEKEPEANFEKESKPELEKESKSELKNAKKEEGAKPELVPILQKKIHLISERKDQNSSIANFVSSSFLAAESSSLLYSPFLC